MLFAALKKSWSTFPHLGFYPLCYNMPLMVLFNSFWVEFHLSHTKVGTAILCFIYVLLFSFTFIFLPFTFHICMSFVNECYIQDIVGFYGWLDLRHFYHWWIYRYSRIDCLNCVVLFEVIAFTTSSIFSLCFTGCPLSAPSQTYTLWKVGLYYFCFYFYVINFITVNSPHKPLLLDLLT